ncbi:class I SAM-dependent methyltransferase [Cellulophaga baltica 4]|nr:class I SAM-dependent methyltransferase [Cellulophaga baltica 4]
METTLLQIADITTPETTQNSMEMVHFYNGATADYKFWSTDYNMHFGYFIPFKTNPFKRDAMLNEMNHQVLKKLALTNAPHTLADLGCGMGGTMRYALKKHPKLTAFGVTLSNFQVAKGNQLLKK